MFQCFYFVLTVPVQLEDDGAIHDGKTQEANPPQEDTAKHAGMEVQDHDLRSGITHTVNMHKPTRTEESLTHQPVKI